MQHNDLLTDFITHHAEGLTYHSEVYVFERHYITLPVYTARQTLRTSKF